MPGVYEAGALGAGVDHASCVLAAVASGANASRAAFGVSGCAHVLAQAVARVEGRDRMPGQGGIALCGAHPRAA